MLPSLSVTLVPSFTTADVSTIEVAPEWRIGPCPESSAMVVLLSLGDSRHDAETPWVEGEQVAHRANQHEVPCLVDGTLRRMRLHPGTGLVDQLQELRIQEVHRARGAIVVVRQLHALELQHFVLESAVPRGLVRKPLVGEE